MRRIFLTFVVSLLIVGGTAWGADQKESSHRQAAIELVTISGLPAQFDALMKQVLDMQFQSIPDAQEIRPVIDAWVAKYLNWEQVKDDFVTLYVQEFSEKELRDLIAFYKTPTGRKSLERMPELFRKGSEIGIEHVRAHEAELNEMVTARIEQLKGEGKPQE